MKIIQATRDMIPQILECAIEYTNDIPHIKLDGEHFIRTVESLFDGGVGVIFLAVEDGRVIGGIGGIKYPNLLTGVVTLSEIFWYVKKGERGCGVRLYKQFERYARENGCGNIMMAYLTCSMPEELKQFYIREGYTLTEMHFEKELI